METNLTSPTTRILIIFFNIYNKGEVSYNMKGLKVEMSECVIFLFIMIRKERKEKRNREECVVCVWMNYNKDSTKAARRETE